MLARRRPLIPVPNRPRQCGGCGSNPRPLSRKSDALTTTPPAFALSCILVHLSMLLLPCGIKQGVALTRRHYWPAVECYSGTIIRLEAAWRHRMACAGEAASSLIIALWVSQKTTTTDASEHHYETPYTVCRRASNNKKYLVVAEIKSWEFEKWKNRPHKSLNLDFSSETKIISNTRSNYHSITATHQTPRPNPMFWLLATISATDLLRIGCEASMNYTNATLLAYMDTWHTALPS